MSRARSLSWLEVCVLIFKTVVPCSWSEEEDPQGGHLNEPCKESFLGGSLYASCYAHARMVMSTCPDRQESDWADDGPAPQEWLEEEGNGDEDLPEKAWEEDSKEDGGEDTAQEWADEAEKAWEEAQEWAAEAEKAWEEDGEEDTRAWGHISWLEGIPQRSLLNTL